MKRAALAVLLAFCAGAANAHYWDGRVLAETCEHGEGVEKGVPGALEVEAGACMGYILGVAEVLEDDLEAIDIPDDVQVQTLVRIVREYLEENPMELDQPARKLVRRALVEAYPTTPQQKK
jgi:hypothetical protein